MSIRTVAHDPSVPFDFAQGRRFADISPSKTVGRQSIHPAKASGPHITTPRRTFSGTPMADFLLIRRAAITTSRWSAPASERLADSPSNPNRYGDIGSSGWRSP